MSDQPRFLWQGEVPGGPGFQNQFYLVFMINLIYPVYVI